MGNIYESVDVWGEYLQGVDWRELTAGVEPKEGGCGLVRDLENPIDRPNESFAIADMSRLDLSEPHLHTNGETEIYFVLSGAGRIAIGTRAGSSVSELEVGNYVIIRPEHVHIVLPSKDLVLGVVNTPPFNPDNYVTVSHEDEVAAGLLRRLRAN